MVSGETINLFDGFCLGFVTEVSKFVEIDNDVRVTVIEKVIYFDEQRQRSTLVNLAPNMSFLARSIPRTTRTLRRLLV